MRGSGGYNLEEEKKRPWLGLAFFVIKPGKEEKETRATFHSAAFSNRNSRQRGRWWLVSGWRGAEEKKGNVKKKTREKGEKEGREPSPPLCARNKNFCFLAARLFPLRPSDVQKKLREKNRKKVEGKSKQLQQPSVFFFFSFLP